MKMKRFLSLILALTMTLSLGAFALADAEDDVEYDELNIIVAHGGTETMSMHQGWLKFKELLEERSGGSLTVDIYPNQQLGGDREYTEACMLGNVTMGSPSSAPVAAFVPAINVFESPFIYSDREAVYAALDSDAGKALLDTLEESNLKGLGYFENGFRELSLNKELNSMDDLKGIKIRVMENDVHIAVWKALGANPSPLAFGELYTALEQKTFDAQENPLETIYNTKFHEVQDHIYLTNHIYTPYLIFMNLDIWNSLNSASQELIQSCLDEAIDYQRELSAAAEQEMRDLIDESGKSKVYDITPELRDEMVEACAPVYDMIRELAGEELVDNFYAAAGFEQ